MLIHRLDSALLDEARRLSREVAERLEQASTAAFVDETEAEAWLWDIVALMQRQASVTARILTTAIDEKNARAMDIDGDGQATG